MKQTQEAPADVRPSMPGQQVNQPIRVMHLLHTMGYGGVETVLLNWVRRMDRTRFTPHLVCFANPGATEKPFLDAAAAMDLPVRCIPWRRSKPVWEASTALVRLMREESIDVLHTHNTYADVVGLVAARRYAVRTMTTLYVWGDFGWKRNALQWMNRKVLSKFDMVSAHCEVTYHQTLEFGVPRERLRLHTCGFEAKRCEMPAEERALRREARGVRGDTQVLVNVARLYPEKQQAWLLEIFRAVLDRHPETRLWIAGVGPLEGELRRQCAELGLGAAVDFLGFDADLPALLALADVHVNTSSAEGVPLAICSAMAAGLPIVATDVGGLPEILDHGRAGVLVPWKDTQCFVDEVLCLLNDPEMRAHFGGAARRFIEQDYSLDAAVGRLEHTYLEMVGACA